MTRRGPRAGGVRSTPYIRTQFDFVRDDVRYPPTIRRSPAAQNLCAARERLARISQRIRAGTFLFEVEFPEYRFLRRVIDPSQVRTCDQIFDPFIEHCESRFRRDDLAWATVSGDRRVIHALWRLQIGTLSFLRVDDVTLARAGKTTVSNERSLVGRMYCCAPSRIRRTYQLPRRVVGSIGAGGRSVRPIRLRTTPEQQSAITLLGVGVGVVGKGQLCI